MKTNDYYYRAFIEYKKIALSDKGIQDFLRQIRTLGSNKKARLTIEKVKCEVSEDWISEIENNLKYIEKAISQERQFIRTNGEVVLIEKTKSISKESISHLAKHASLIKEVDEETDQVKPEKIYTVEKLSDYAVYENRFLYLLLTYLRDFTTERYNKITQSSGKYYTVLDVASTYKTKQRNIKYTLNIEDENMSLSKDSDNAKVVERIEDVLNAILKLLSTPLMVEVSKVPMIKPPITKTNVLKMETNFKYALALYEYISSYTAPGYTITREAFEKQLDASAEDDINNAVLLLLFMMQMHSLDLKEGLQLELEKQLKLEEEQRAEELKERLEYLKSKAKLSGKSLDEYLVSLNERIEQLEAKEVALKSANSLAAKQTEKIDSLKGEIVSLKDGAKAKEREYLESMAKKDKAHADEIDVMTFEKEDLESKIQELEENIASLNQKLEENTKEKDQLMTQNNAFRTKLGLAVKEKDYTDEDKFKLIEKEYKIVGDYYKMAWKKTKKRLKKEILFGEKKDEEK
ncbi:MAG: hypothetical protein E7338_01865 [Clostridiales bacterium]|nr:hypothetical protein [Clostridiales bacterium]